MFAAGNLILKVKFWAGSPRNIDAAPSHVLGVAPAQLPSAAPGRTKFAAPSRGPAAAPSQLPNAAPPRRTPVARGRGTRTFVRNVCSPTDRSVVRSV